MTKQFDTFVLTTLLGSVLAFTAVPALAVRQAVVQPPPQAAQPEETEEEKEKKKKKKEQEEKKQQQQQAAEERKRQQQQQQQQQQQPQQQQTQQERQRQQQAAEERQKQQAAEERQKQQAVEERQKQQAAEERQQQQRQQQTADERRPQQQKQPTAEERQQQERQVQQQIQQDQQLKLKRQQEERQLKQKRVTQQEQQERVRRQEAQLALYRKNIALREELAERDAQILRQQKRIQHLRFQEQYEERLRAQRLQLMQARYDYYNDPFYYTAPNYRYRRAGQYYMTNQYGMRKIEQALQAGYNEGYRAGRADREDRWRYDFRSAFAYRDANYGYDGRYIAQDEYNYYFREGFERGYEDGYYSRNKYGRRNHDGGINDEWLIAGAVVAAIIGYELLTD
jgi:hypothetical protein